MKSDFVAMVSHELRTPLTSIKGALSLLISGAAGPLAQTARNMIDIAFDNSERLIRLINDILDIEKIESGQITLDIKPVELAAWLHDAVELNKSYSDQHDVTLELCPLPDDVIVAVDPDRIGQVLANLISNAAKFSPKGGRVKIAVHAGKRSVRIEIADQGAGIPEGFKGRIFTRFAQASEAREKNGSGLGLSIAKAIVEAHAGKIGFHSVEGRGATFHFEIPIYDPPEAPATNTPMEEHRLKILADGRVGAFAEG